MNTNVKLRPLFKKTGSQSWWYAISVPPAFRHLFNNAKEIKASTRQTDKRLAEQVQLGALVAFNLKCAKDDFGGTSAQLLRPEHVQTIISTVCIKIRQEFEVNWRAGAYLGTDPEWGGPVYRKKALVEWQKGLERLVAQAGSNFLDYWGDVRLPVETYAGVTLAEHIEQDPLLFDFCMEFAERVLPQLDYMLERLNGKRVIAPQLEIDVLPPSVVRSKSAGTLWDAYNSWAELQTNLKTKDSRSHQVKVFVDYCGLKPVAEYTDEDCINFVRSLRTGQLKPSGKPLSETSIENYTVGLKAIFSEARRKRMRSGDCPFRDVEKRRVQNVFTSKITTALTVEQLQSMFATGSPYAELKQPEHILPLLALYTGGRLQELSQLRKTDFFEQGGRHWIRITGDEDESDTGLDKRKLKNHGSVRDVPLHAAIVATGLVEWVKKKAPISGNIWGLTPNKYGSLGQAISKHWTRHCEAKDIPGRFHRLRHTFTHYCREAKVDRETRERILGHTQAMKEGENYGAGTEYPKQLLLDAIDTYRVINSLEKTTLDTSHITIHF